MAVDRTGAGDPARTLELLWRAQQPVRRRRGPLQGRSIDAVVVNAIELADAEGLEGLTMRRIAERVGISPMSVYTYVPGKAELLDLMLDSVYADMPRPRWRTKSWRGRLTLVARRNRELFMAHPWAAGVVSLSRPPLGPGLMAKYEHELSAFDDTGLDDVPLDAALTYLLGFVQASARAAAEVDAVRRESQIDDAAWWEANAPLLSRIFDEKSYPRAVRVGAAAGAAQGAAYHPDHAYEFGLQRVLDGLGVLIGERT